VPQLRARRLGIDTYQQPVVYMRADFRVCRAEGFEAQSRLEVRAAVCSDGCRHDAAVFVDGTTHERASTPSRISDGLRHQ